MKMTVVGGVNVGTQFAAHGAANGHDVTVYTAKAEAFSDTLEVTDREGNLRVRGRIRSATGDPARAFSGAEAVFVTTPAFLAEKTAREILPRLESGTKLFFVPGTGGMECVFRKATEKGCTLYGLQRVPSVARVAETGKRVCAEGYRSRMFVAALPHADVKEGCEIVGGLFGIPCDPLPNYLNVTMVPSNPILHTTRLYSLFGGDSPDKIDPYMPLFYEEWDDAASEILFRCDDELQRVCRAMTDFDLSYVRSLKEHYESDTPRALTEKIRSIRGFRGLTTPAVACDGGFRPDFSSRYFVSDFAYGLTILCDIAELAGVPSPNMHEVLDWYMRRAGTDQRLRFSDYGISDYASFYKFYSA